MFDGDALRPRDDDDECSADLWWGRPAMKWSGSSVGEASEDPYFPAALLPWIRNEEDTDEATCGDAAETNAPKIQCMEYCVFMHLCAYVTERLLLLLTASSDDEHLAAQQQQQQRPALVIVAIPKGPFLPLAVAAVHVVNATPHRSILIPIDPKQAAVLATPAFSDEELLIIVAGNCDKQRIEQALSGVSSSTAERGSYSIHNVHDLLPTEESYPSASSCPVTLSSSPQSFSLAHAIAACATNALIELDTAIAKEEEDWISHIVFTSGTTTGRPKGCVNSRRALLHYLSAKNAAHGITTTSSVYLSSSIAFDPCFSDCLATFTARATLVLPPFHPLLLITHVLCTPTQWKSYNWTIPPPPPPERLVVALGGESIPERMRLQAGTDPGSHNIRLLATYGVTEACVYQTAGVVNSSKQKGYVGSSLPGMYVVIWQEEDNENGDRATSRPLSNGSVGEVVLYGSQLNDLSGYYKQPELTKTKFLRVHGQMYYRTGDRGFVRDGELHIVGRISGDDMVKLNGVRVQLGDIEQALLTLEGVVDDALVVGHRQDGDDTTTSVSDLHAFIVLNPSCWSELAQGDCAQSIPPSGLICTSRPLLELLHKCCQINTRVVPTVFILLDEMPTTSTGKRNPRGLPPIEKVKPMQNDDGGCALADFGRSGKFVANEIRDRLNLLPSQEVLMTSKSSYAMLGGDSLTATQIVRSLYARHCNIPDSRHLGGNFGTLAGPFAPNHLLGASNLGNYVDWLDKHGAFTDSEDVNRNQTAGEPTGIEPSLPSADADVSLLHDALMQSCSLHYNSIATCLLSFTDPNHGHGRFRMAKTSRLDRKTRFRPSPLHVACFHGNLELTKTLLDNGAKYNIPNPSGFFPLHLAASGEYHAGHDMPLQEQENRLACVQLLLDAGAPRTMADGNKQSVLHAAARTGNARTLEFLSRDWNQHSRRMGLEWRDNWARTPLHWAVLNGHPKALSVLLEAGSHPNPPTVPTTKTNTSLITETPLEICRRVHGKSSAGICMEELLLNAIAEI